MLEIISEAPSDPELSKHIEFYYFMSSKDPNFSKSFDHYPHIRTTLNIYHKCRVEVDPKSRKVISDPEAETQYYLTNSWSGAKSAIVQGPVDIIGVVFRPLGINHYLPTDFSRVFVEDVVSLPDIWSPLKQSAASIFATTSTQDRVRILDSCFSAQRKPFDQKALLEMVQQLLDNDGKVEANQLAEIVGISRRTAQRLFQRHLGCSISTFRKIIKFRKALDLYHNSGDKPSLTEVAHLANFYDQSDFINQFKSQVGASPKKEIALIESMTKPGLLWKMRN